MGERLKNACAGLMGMFRRGSSVDEGQVHAFWEGVFDYLEEEEYGEPPAELNELSDILQKKLLYGGVEQMTPEQAFLYGGIWGGVRLLDIRKNHRRRRLKIHKLKKRYEDYYDFFSIIDINPGIRHKDLAERLGKSVSQLSQLADRIDRDDLIYCDYMGREKYYYLSSLGKQLYTEIKKEKVQRMYHRMWYGHGTGIQWQFLSDLVVDNSGEQGFHLETVKAGYDMFVVEKDSFAWEDNYVSSI